MARILVLSTVLFGAACGASQDAEPGQPIVVEPPAQEEDGSDEGSDPRSDEGSDEIAQPEEEAELVISNDVCETDEDCVPGGCCHAATCVARDDAPTCSDVMCTQDCRYGTLDCGGACLCHEGRCAARLSVAPAMLPRE
jgi:hypothetical protein